MLEAVAGRLTSDERELLVQSAGDVFVYCVVQGQAMVEQQLRDGWTSDSVG